MKSLCPSSCGAWPTIEYAEGNFYFVLEDDGKARIWQPWELVRQFEKVDYWSMFGDAGASPYKTGWHAIAMTPLVGRPWMIGSTIEGEAYVRERFTELDARFSADTRAQFMRAFEARKSSAERQTMTQTVPAVPGQCQMGACLRALTLWVYRTSCEANRTSHGSYLRISCPVTRDTLGRQTVRLRSSTGSGGAP